VAGVFALLVGSLFAISRSRGQVRAPKSWDPNVLDLVTFVEKSRGLTFKRPVTIKYLNDVEFDAWLSRGDGADADKNTFLAEEAVGLVETGYDPKAGVKGRRDGTVGVYAPADKTVRVRGTELTPYVKLVLVHELTHALQDQSFNLGKVQRKAKTENEYLGINAVIEGDATLVENDWYWDLDQTERSEIDDFEDSLRDDGDDFPAGLGAKYSLPYALGDEFVLVTSARSATARNDLFRDPPLNSVVLIDPSRYLDGNVEPKLKKPSTTDAEADGPEEVGATLWFLALATAAEPAEVRAAMSSFSTDRAVFTRRGERACMEDVVAPVSVARLDSLEKVFQSWAADDSSRIVTRKDDTLLVKSCSIATRVEVTEFQADFSEVITRSQLMSALLKNGDAANDRQAVCIAESAVENYDIDELIDVIGSGDTSELVEDITTCPA
jgi:hypothetical protein